MDAYRQGVSLEELGDKYCLSVQPYEKLYIRSKPWGAAVRPPFSAGLSGVYQADAETIIQNSTEENSRLHIRFPGDRIESPEIRKQK